MHTIEIDRIVLTDLGVNPERAECIKELVGVELQRLLEQEGWPDGLAGGELDHLEAPPMHLTQPHSDGHLAKGLAHSIAQALRGV